MQVSPGVEMSHGTIHEKYIDEWNWKQKKNGKSTKKKLGNSTQNERFISLAITKHLAFIEAENPFRNNRNTNWK